MVVGAGESDQDMLFEGVATGASQPELAAWDSGFCEEAMDAHEPDASVDDSNLRLGTVDLFDVAGAPRLPIFDGRPRVEASRPRAPRSDAFCGRSDFSERC